MARIWYDKDYVLHRKGSFMYRYWIRSLLIPSLTAALLIFIGIVLYKSITKHKSGRTINWGRAALIALFFGYMVGLFSITLEIETLLETGPRFDGEFNLVPFRQIRRFLNYMESAHANVNLWGNILVFMPVGFFIPLLWRRKKPLLAGTLWTMGVSLFIETFQLITPRVSDIDDIILNTLGGFLGALLYLLFRRLFSKTDERLAPTQKIPPLEKDRSL